MQPSDYGANNVDIYFVQSFVANQFVKYVKTDNPIGSTEIIHFLFYAFVNLL